MFSANGLTCSVTSATREPNHTASTRAPTTSGADNKGTRADCLLAGTTAIRAGGHPSSWLAPRSFTRRTWDNNINGDFPCNTLGSLQPKRADKSLSTSKAVKKEPKTQDKHQLTSSKERLTTTSLVVLKPKMDSAKLRSPELHSW